MSSLPGYTLEEYVMWDMDLIVDGDGGANPSLEIAESLGSVLRRSSLTMEQFLPILELYEPWREQVESCLDDFDDETQSWRDYAGDAFGFIPVEVIERAAEIRDGGEGDDN